MEELRQTYQHRQDIIETLIAKCKELYLLTEPSAEHTALTHDTLAPVVAKEYSTSFRSGQRATRILNGKMSDFGKKSSNIWLDEADLTMVENGESGMRKLNASEEQLLELSRLKRRQRQRLRKQLWAGGVVMLLLVVAFAIYGWVERSAAVKRGDRAKEEKLIADAEKMRAMWSLFSSLTVNMREGQPGSVSVRPSSAKTPAGDGGAWIVISRLPKELQSSGTEYKIEQGLVVRDDPNREVSRDFIVARQYGLGHVLVYAHDGLTTDNEIETGSDNLLFAENALRWLARSEAQKECPAGTTVLLWEGSFVKADPHLGEVKDFIQRRGWTLKVAAKDKLGEDLGCASILWYLSDWDPPANFASEDVPLITDFVQKGGGLLVGGLGWSYGQSDHKEPYAANELGKPFGFAFTAEAFTTDPGKAIQLLSGNPR
jgi:hypothetical protein